MTARCGFYQAQRRKALEAQQDHNVCISFADAGKGIYVSLTGQAKVTTDRELIDKYWNSYVGAWFPEGKDDPNVAMLEVEIHFGEYWLSDENKLFQLFETTKANIKDEKPNLGGPSIYGGRRRAK